MKGRQLKDIYFDNNIEHMYLNIFYYVNLFNKSSYLQTREIVKEDAKVIERWVYIVII